jgi:hypothetical protein
MLENDERRGLPWHQPVRLLGRLEATLAVQPPQRVMRQKRVEGTEHDEIEAPAQE